MRMIHIARCGRLAAIGPTAAVASMHLRALADQARIIPTNIETTPIQVGYNHDMLEIIR